ncbi:uncharacterized protein LOC143593361 [Bidens hawaiensis]|uniref:uncharacterized protein LOC143593361 n=1 Tax=Bidens hawaiensis TaxID=980011 RepID=UPI00404B1BD3
MCPPASDPSAVELDQYSTDETICKLLMQLQNGKTPPQNVLSDLDPYQYPPSNLPADMWYFLSGSKTDATHGFWRSTGEACEIYSTSLTVCLRKTLQFYEGPTDNGQKTNWMMQEYTTTEIYTSKLDHGALCRVFLVDDSSSGAKSELVKNVDDVAGPSDAANKSLNQFLDDCVSQGDYLAMDDLDIPLSRTTNVDGVARLSDVASQSSNQLRDDYVLQGDYLAMDDLDIPLSRTTSSGDSSGITRSMTSEELFDADDLMRELGDDTVDQEIPDSKIKLNFSAPAKLTQVVMKPTTSGSLDIVKESKPCTGQTSKTNPTSEVKSTSNEVNTSAASPPSSSSNSSEGSSKEEKKKDNANRAKKRKLMKFLCFLAF